MKGLLKFITCGSVDDGKSTLIGHILYDAKLIYADQEKALELDSKVGSRSGDIDYSLLLDGLMAEREQGITIDVAYRYFTTDNRSFIVADTPGHEEYTRNMAVGASFADLAVILIDASQGVLVQTRRHARICKLMGIRHFVFAVNKMDLVKYSKSRFDEIVKQIEELKNELLLDDIYIIPLSATEGDNVTVKSENIPWYNGVPLLQYLETVDVDSSEEEEGFYLPVQRVCRPDHTFRGFQGQIESGSISIGDEIVTLPSNEKAHVKQILMTDKDVKTAFKGQPVIEESRAGLELDNRIWEMALGQRKLIQPACWMDNLENVLFQFPNMEIVISSSWREHYSLNSLKNLFSSSIRNKISDTTPVIYDKSYSDGGREAEILLWLKQHNRPHEHWIAIDDSLNLFNLYVHHVFECDPMIGLDGPNTQNLIQFMRHHEIITSI